MNVNEKVRFLREAQGWSQEEMAEKVGLSVHGYAKIERGETQLNIPRLRQICDVLNYDLLELMTLGEKMWCISKKVATTLAIIIVSTLLTPLPKISFPKWLN